MKTEKLHFTVDPDGITELVRSMWFGEHKCAKAMDIMMDGFGMNVEQALSVISGHKKLISDDGVNFGLADDAPVVATGTPATWEGLMARLAKLEEMADKFTQLEQFATIIHSANGVRSARGSMVWTSHASPVGYITPSLAIEFLAQHIDEPTTEEYEEFWKENGLELREMNSVRPGEDIPLDHIKDSTRDLRIDKAGDDLADQWSKHTATDVDIALAHMRQLDKMPAPKATTSYESKDAWITPDGKFYPVRYMEHIWAADKIAGITEKDAELRGWIKISDPIMMGQQVFILGGKSPTQKQIDTLFDWCEAHDFTFPDWAKTE